MRHSCAAGGTWKAFNIGHTRYRGNMEQLFGPLAQPLSLLELVMQAIGSVFPPIFLIQVETSQLSNA